MTGFRLFEIDQLLRDAIAVAEEKVDQETGELPGDWGDFLDTVQLERDQKCLAVAAYIKECKAEGEAIAKEAKELIRRSKACENRAERMKQYLARAMQVKEVLSDTRVRIGWRESSSVVIDNESKLPESCFKIVREVSKTEVKALLESDKLEAGIAHIEKHNNIQVK